MNPTYTQLSELSAADIDLVSGASPQAMFAIGLGLAVIGVGVEVLTGGLGTPLAVGLIATGVTIVHVGAGAEIDGY